MHHSNLKRITMIWAGLVAVALIAVSLLVNSETYKPKGALNEASIQIDQTDPSYYADARLKFIDLEVENRIFDPYDDQEARINFTLKKGAYLTLEITDEDDEEVAIPVSKQWYAPGDYTITWNGEDKYGDIVDQDEYSYKLKAENSGEKKTETGTFVIKKGYDQKTDTTDPRIKKFFVTKETFDPGLKEKNYIFFTLQSKADVKISIYDSEGNKIENISDEKDVQPGTYSVQWEGDRLVNKKAQYTYKISAQNSRGNDTVSGTVKVEKEEKESKKPNIYKDTTGEFPFNPSKGNLTITFKQELDADVTVEIRDQDIVVATLLQEKATVEGTHSFNWDGRDDSGVLVDDGVYQYKIVAANLKGKDVEKGNFQVENSSKAKNKFARCGGFEDLDITNPYCKAIEWCKSQGIFSGYNDGTFRPGQEINRAEALKVILAALKIKVTDDPNLPLNFSDVDKYAWYTPHLKTALNLGVVNGYANGTFKPYQSMQRAEALVVLLNTAKVSDGVTIPTNNYVQPYYDVPNDPSTKWYISYAWFAKAYTLSDNDYYFYPQDNITRAELADMLYRYRKLNIGY